MTHDNVLPTHDHILATQRLQLQAAGLWFEWCCPKNCMSSGEYANRMEWSGEQVFDKIEPLHCFRLRLQSFQPIVVLWSFHSKASWICLCKNPCREHPLAQHLGLGANWCGLRLHLGRWMRGACPCPCSNWVALLFYLLHDKLAGNTWELIILISSNGSASLQYKSTLAREHLNTSSRVGVMYLDEWVAKKSSSDDKPSRISSV